MSFLTQVLSTATQADIEIIKQNLPLTTQSLINFAKDVTNYIDDCYRTYTEYPERREDFENTVGKLKLDVKDLQEKIDHVTTQEVPNKLKEIDSVSNEMSTMYVELNFVTFLVDIHELFMRLREFEEVDDCIAAAPELCKLGQCFANISKDEFNDVFKLLHSKFIMKKANVWYKLDKIYEKNLNLVDKDVGNSAMNLIKIRKSYDFTDLLKAYNYLKEGNIEQLDSLSKFILSYFCQPIISHTTNLKVENKDGFVILIILIKKSSPQESYKSIYAKLLEVFQFLDTYLSCKFDEFNSTSYIGKKIGQVLSEMLIKNCLSVISNEDLLKTPEDEKHFQEIMSESMLFQQQLVKFNIFAEDSTVITDYVNSLEMALINKKCNEHLSNSIKIMKQDLHNFVEVAEITSVGNVADFSSCCVSRSVLDLLTLTKQQLENSVTENDLFRHNLISTIQTIFNQYSNIVYEHHKKLLESIPQQVALYRNNCMYLAFNLVQLDETYKGKFSSLNSGIFTYHVLHLKEMGNQIFSKYIQQQVKQMETTLNDHQFNTQTLSDRLNPDMDKCIRQCMRQYELLKTVWRKILPLAIYNETLSYLLNTFCKKLIDVVIATEDLPSKNSEQLVDMFKIIITRGPKLFDDSNEICLLVKNWQKLNDLIFILCGSLNDIDDRWSNGKGPLTLHFQAEEVRKLIKALFQNTDRRDAVLSRICD